MANQRYLKLNAQEISDLLAFYGIELHDYKLLSGGSANTNYYINSGRQEYILTISQNKSDQELKPLIEALLYLEDHGYQSTKIYGNKAGKYLNWFGEFPVLLKSYIPGNVPEKLNRDQAFILGSKIAGLHRLPIPDFLPGGFDYDQEHMLRFLSSNNIDHAFTNWLNQFLEQYRSLFEMSLPKAIVHADIFTDNLVIFEGEPVIIDFEEICVYQKVFDVGMAIIGTCRGEQGLDMELLKSLLAGYADQLALTTDEKEALKMMTAFAAASTAFWRYRQFNVIDPNPLLSNHYEEMVQLADWVMKQDFSTSII